DLGCLFQLADDLLDGTGDSHVLGKPTGRDLESGCLTLKAVVALAEPSRGPEVRHCIASLVPRPLTRLRALLEEPAVAERALILLDALGHITLDSLTVLPSGAARTQLQFLVEQLQATARQAALGDRTLSASRG
ncbi:MAG: polyprenyl synthetase family protein, partial [Cyanobacteria bacterium REEB65]|nr:polyprenyl synthetase family protein [Cyanobacteria bacterium REEB65]